MTIPCQRWTERRDRYRPAGERIDPSRYAVDVLEERRIVCTAVIGAPVTDHPSPWAVPGAWQFPLLDVRPASSGVLGGALGVWRFR